MREMPRFLKKNTALSFVSLLLIFAGPLTAQSWTNPVFPVSQSLWGVCYGPAGFVAVGEGGTLLQSADGIAWTSKNSGGAQWLLGASQANGIYVVVGENGTVLTSTDANTWIARTSGVTERLNAVTYGGGVWLAVGEGGVVIASSDAITWTRRTLGDGGWFRGLAFGGGAFVVAGHDGTIYVTRDGGVSFDRSLIATTQGLEGVVFDGETFHVVGGGRFAASSSDGLNWRRNRLSMTGPAYRAVAIHAGAIFAAGDSSPTDISYILPTLPSSGNWRALASSTVRAVGVGAGGAVTTYTASTHYNPIKINFPAGPYMGQPAKLSSSVAVGSQWQWLLNDKPIVGATTPILEIPSLSAANAGRYTIAVTRADGGPTATSSVVMPTLLPNAPTLGAIDTSYRVPFSEFPQVIKPLPDGRVYVADRDAFYLVNGRRQHGLVRLLADGSFDSSFNVGTGLDLEGTVTDVYPLSDGGVAIRGTFASINGVSKPQLARLNADGSLDVNFQPSTELREAVRSPILLRDNRWIVIQDPSGSANIGLSTTMQRFAATGEKESDLFLTIIDNDLYLPKLSGAWKMAADGRIYVFGTYSIAQPIGGFVTRLNVDGTHDPSFLTLGNAIIGSALLPEGLMVATDTFTSAAVNWRHDGEFSRRTYQNGERDSSFAELNWTYGAAIGDSSRVGTSAFRYSVLAPDNSGGLYAAVDGLRGHQGIVHLSSTGESDANFSLECDLPTGWESTGDLLALTDGKILVYGIREINGLAVPGIVRLSPNRAAGTSRLSNLSVRARTGSGSQTLIVGYVTANGQKDVLIRGAGPALAPFGVVNFLSDPVLTLFNGVTVLAGNDDWSNGDSSTVATAAARVGAFAFTPASRDAALLSSAAAGAYTIQLTGKAADTGVALAELYDTGASPINFAAPRIVNFSTRTQAGTGADSLIAGFTVSGVNTRRFVIRAIGPSLEQFGVSGVLADPQMTLFRGDVAIASNDNWSERSDFYQNQEAEAFKTVGAFSVPFASKDAALIVSLAPGGYTVQVTGAGNAQGVALLEIYEIP